ncbi:MAG: DUF4238 domain-containing protein [Chloroflexi bacterium]|nr:DUF4238 domain-containing protein [Chloroflexota bacterium]
MPSFYLKGFALPSGSKNVSWQISAYNRETGKTLAKTSIANVPVENDLYKNWDVDEADAYHVEIGLAKLESRAAVALKNATDHGKVEAADIPLIRDFLVYTYVRTTAYRKHTIRGAAEWIPSRGVEQVRAKGPPAGAGKEFRASFDPYLDLIASGEVRIEEHPNFGLRMQFPPPDGLFDGLASGWNYVVVYVGADRLVTSDVPIALYSLAADHFGVIHEIGLANADELWMPLDPSHGLLLSRDSSLPPWLGSLSEERVRAWNNAISAASDRWTIWHPESAALRFVELPGMN